MNNLFSTNNSEDKGITHIVKKGETLYKIANTYHTTPAALMQLNNLQNTLLSIGQLLIITEPSFEFKENLYNNISEFMEDHKGIGYLKVHVYSAGGIYPLKNASVEISKQFRNEKKIFFKKKTEENGMVDAIPLPALLITNQDFPEATAYNIEVFYEHYKQLSTQKTYIYDGIKSIQKIELMPSTEESTFNE